ncbi:MAG: class I SAM-dependent methyltransferase [Candidatus Cyclobacteriaceae bacterium M3_2C_046]
MSNAEKIRSRYNRIAGIYDILEGPMENMFRERRKSLLSEARGKVLEVGIGTGKNILYYSEPVQLVGIDFSPGMIEKAKQKFQLPNVQLLTMDAENMAFKDNEFDTVVTSCVFCSVPDPVKGLKEIRRVCRNGGKILMLEHVRSENKFIGSLMDMVNAVPLHVYGANINRRTIENLKKAGFSEDNMNVENIWYDIMKVIRIKNIKKEYSSL